MKCLIDTGSSTSLLNETKLPQYKRKPLAKPIKFNTLNSDTFVNSEIKTDLPIEFNEDAYMIWKLTKFKNKSFDAILGQNLLRPLGAIIDMKKEVLIINKNEINFLSKCPYKENEINQLEHVEINETVEENLVKGLNSEEKNLLNKLLKSYKNLFFKEGEQLTSTSKITHEIITTTQKPIYSKIYRYPQVHEEEISSQIEDMLKQGIIKESNSPYNSPLWIVPKKIDNSGKKKWRIVIDYRKLNEVTIDDKFPIPNIENILDKLGRAQYFTTLDLAKGFHQILVNEEDRKKTAFSTPQGHYEYIRMPFGLKNAPATFQRLMNDVLKEYINKICVVYLDDILIFSTTLNEHIENIKKIFNKLKEYNLKIQIDKCKFFAKETEYLGHILTPEGVKPNPKKVEDIAKLKLPETEKQIKSFLGVTGYYRKFIRDYAKVAQPMTKYLKKNAKINLKDTNYINSFEKLKKLITEAPILKYPDFKKNFKLVTDASAYAIGAVLQQENHPVCYASRTLNEHERNYSTTEKELLAIVWATNYFRPYLYGVKFNLLTDHQPLKWLYTKTQGKDVNPRLYRWLLKLGEYNINVDYIKGKENRVADFLSRINTDTHEIENNRPPTRNEKLFDLHKTQNTNNKLIETINHVEGRNDNTPYNTEDIEASEEDSLYNNFDQNSVGNNSNDDSQTIHSQQEDLNNHINILDTIVNRFKTQIILTDNKNNEIEIKHNNRKIYINSKDLENNFADILRRYIKPGKIGIYTDLDDHKYNILQQKLIELFDNDPTVKFIRCSYHAKDINSEEEAYRQISKYHKNETGHTGINENYEGLKRYIYYPNLKKLIHKYINNCDICNRVKYDRKPIKQKFERTETPTDIRQIVHMDVYTNSKGNFLTFIDRFSKFATAFYLEDRNNQTIIEKIREFKSQRGHFNKLITDNEFKSINIKDYMRSENIELHLVKSNNHTGNSDIERLHSTLSERIRVLGLTCKDLNIKEKISKAIEYYNNSYHSTTKEKPINIQEGRCSKTKIFQNLSKEKDRYITKRNQNRENYEENRTEGYIKNYKSLRHKEVPKFIKTKLENVHKANIKRKNKFSGELDIENIPSNVDDDSSPVPPDPRED